VFSANTPKDIVAVNEPDFFQYVKAYPNPAIDVLNINLSIGNIKAVEIQIYNELGMALSGFTQKVQNQKEHLLQFDVSDLPSGIYYFELKAGEYNKTGNFMVQ